MKTRLALLCLLLLSACTSTPAPEPTPTPTVSQSYQSGLDQAMQAATAAQTAKTREQWLAVEKGWDDAIALLIQVPREDPNRDAAQAKVAEYRKNKNYAAVQAFTAGKVSEEFANPVRFFPKNLADTAKALGGTIAQSGDRFLAEDSTAKFYAESSGRVNISYIELGVKSLGPCRVEDAILQSRTILELAGITGAEKVREAPDSGYTTYELNGLKVQTFCSFDGDWYTVGIGR